jgi:hypothetical protein
MSVFCQAVAYLLLALPTVAQSQAFAKVTIRPARSADAPNMRMQVLPNGDLIANAVPLAMLLSYAYDVPVNPSPRFSPLPEWTILERYDIEGKAPANAITPSLQDNESRSRTHPFMLSPWPATVRSFRSRPSPRRTAHSIPTRKVAITSLQASASPRMQKPSVWTTLPTTLGTGRIRQS